MSSQVFPRRNLPESSEDWGRKVEDQIRELSKENTLIKSTLSNLNRTMSGVGSALSATRRQTAFATKSAQAAAEGVQTVWEEVHNPRRQEEQGIPLDSLAGWRAFYEDWTLADVTLVDGILSLEAPEDKGLYILSPPLDVTGGDWRVAVDVRAVDESTSGTVELGTFPVEENGEFTSLVSHEFVPADPWTPPEDEDIDPEPYESPTEWVSLAGTVTVEGHQQLSLALYIPPGVTYEARTEVPGESEGEDPTVEVSTLPAPLEWRRFGMYEVTALEEARKVLAQMAQDAAEHAQQALDTLAQLEPRLDGAEQDLIDAIVDFEQKRAALEAVVNTIGQTADTATQNAQQAHNTAVEAWEKALASASSGGSLILNGGFEQGLAEWGGDGELSTPGHTGDNALKLTPESSAHQTQTIPTSEGRVYLIGGWVKRLSGASTAGGSFTAEVSSPTSTETVNTGNVLENVSSEWTKVSGKVTVALEDATELKFGLTLGAGDSVVAWDGLFAVDVTEAEAALAAAEEARSHATAAEQAVAVAVVGSEVEYAKNLSPTNAPTTGWAESQTHTEGSYIWQRTKVTYGDGSEVYTSPVLMTGNTGPSGDSLYTWFKYADTPTTGMSNSPVGKSYVGIAYNQPTDAPSSNYGDYEWTLFKGDPGDSGDSLYTWVKYAVSDTGAGMSDEPEGKDYIGLAFNKTSPVASDFASDYTWSLIKGTDGVKGDPGSDGKSLYTWVKYAPNGSPTNAQITDLPQSNSTHIGLAYNKTTATESTSASAYTWTLIQGPKGDEGDKGDQGVSVTSVTPHFRRLAESATKPAKPSGMTPSGWVAVEPDYARDTTVWRSDRIVFSNDQIAWTDVSKSSSYEAAKAAEAEALAYADQMKQAAIDAAATDAQAKAEAAEAAAAAEALRIAQAEAAREADEAEQAAKAYADLQASGASSDALAQAKAYAEAQAEEARIAAEAAAAADATAKAEAAEAAATASAAADAQAKADAAKQAAIDAGALDLANLQIGGRNLYQQAGGEYLTRSNATYNPEIVVEDGRRALAFNSSNNIISTGRRNAPIIGVGETITFSFWAKGSKPMSLGRVYLGSGSGNTSFIRDTMVTEEWQRFSFTHTVTSELSMNLHMYPQIREFGEDGEIIGHATFFLTDMKLERGSKTTDWTPAPEDVDAGIAGAIDEAAITAQAKADAAKQAAIDAARTDRLSNYGYAYQKTVTVYGDHDKAYPVVIFGGDQTVKRTIMVKRSYSQTGPGEWNPSLPTHRGGLNLEMYTNFGGWGGAQYSWEIKDLAQQYNQTFGSALNVASNMGFAIMLRGGGEGGAVYNLYSDQPVEGVHSVTGEAFPAIYYEGDTITNLSGTHSFKMPDPRPFPLAETHLEDIRTRYTPKLAQEADGKADTAISDASTAVQRANAAVKDTKIEYAVNTSETTAPTSGWSTSTPTRTPGSYVWMRTTITYGSGDTTTTNPALLTGNDGARGPKGDQGIPGNKGADGTQYYTWLKYAPNGNPTSAQMTDVPNTSSTHMGLALNQTSPTEGTDPSAYTWSLIKGTDGVKGDPGVDGVSVESITPFFQRTPKSSSAPANPGGVATPPEPWTETEPSYVVDTALWRTDRVVYSDGSVSYTTVTRVTSYDVAAQAMLSANGKNSIIRSTYDASGSVHPQTGQPNVEGDEWWKLNVLNAAGRTVGRWQWDGSTWVPVKISHEVIDSVDVNQLKVHGTGAIDTAVIEKLWAEMAHIVKLSANQILVHPGNEFPDPYFEDTAGWTGLGVALIQDASVPGNVLQITGTTTVRGSYYHDLTDAGKTMALRSGDKYRVTLRRKSSVLARDIEMRLISSGETTQTTIPRNSVADTWEEVSFEITAPTGVGKALPSFHTRTTLGSGVIQIADVRVTSMVDGTLITPGSITSPHLNITDTAWMSDAVIGDLVGRTAFLEYLNALDILARRVIVYNSEGEVVTKLDGEGDQAVAVADSTGEVTAYMSPAGQVAARSLNVADSIIYRGTELTELLDNKLAAFYQVGRKNVDTVLAQWLRIVTVPYEAKPNHVYEVRVDGLEVSGTQNGWGAEISLHTSLASEGAPTLMPPLATDPSFRVKSSSSTAADVFETMNATWRWVPNTTTTPRSAAATLAIRRTASTGYIKYNTRALTVSVLDLGIRPTQDATEHFEATTPATPPPAVVTRTLTWYGTGFRSYFGNGQPFSGSGPGASYAVQGRTPYATSLGAQKSVIIFPAAAIRTALAGATINKVRVRLTTPHWHYGAGGTARIARHNHASVPASSPSLTPLKDVAMGRGETKWVDVGVDFGNRLRDNTAQGFGLDPQGSTSETDYGYAVADPGASNSVRPAIEITFTK